MRKVRLNDAVHDIAGTVYEVEPRLSHEEEPATAKRPHQQYQSSGKTSEAQTAHRQLFKEAIAYAQAAMADPDLHAIYEKGLSKRTTFHTA